jgi:predicted transcriptional regulator
MPPTSPSDPHPNPLAGSTVAEFATTGILSVQPDAPLEEVAWLMANNRVHAVAVVDDAAAEPPVIRDVDLVAATVSGHYQELRARDVAGTEAVSVRGDERLDRAAQLLARHGVTHLIIRDQRRVPSGILSTLDIARAIAGRGTTSRR